MKKPVAAFLCILLIFPLAACGGRGALRYAEPTSEPTAQSTQQPAEEPLPYVFNEKTLEYSDEYIVMTLPAGFTERADITATADGIYIRYLNFTNPALQGNSVNYTVNKAEPGKSISEMTREDFETMYEETFKRVYQSEIEIKTVNFDETPLGSLPAVLYEYDVTVAGVTLRQLVKLIQETDNLVTVTYTYLEDNGDIYHEAAASINPVDSGGI